jgi:urease accessory protein
MGLMTKTGLAAFTGFVAVTAYAHDIEQLEAPVELGGFVPGFVHPVQGPDHLLAMLSVGILSAQMGGSAIWKVPAMFVAAMVIGGLSGLIGIPVPGIEPGISVSVLVLGLALLMETHLPTAWALIFVAFFGFFHGYAHGSEMPGVAEPLWYALGFVGSTAVIHIVGLLAGFLFTRTRVGNYLLRLIGTLIAGTGGYYLAGSIVS